MKLHVVKIGGSLLDLVDLPERIHAWWQQRSGARGLLIVGGGSKVNALREAHAKGTLGDEQAHWRAIERMDENTRILARKLEGDSWCGMKAFEVTSFLRHTEPNVSGVKLPVGWEVTSDSIAARVAIGVGAEELHLLKSRLPTEDESQSLETQSLKTQSLKTLVESGYIDPFLLQLAEEIPKITAWNLREEPAISMVI